MNNSWTIPETIHWSIPEETRKSWDRRIPYFIRFRDYFTSMIESGLLVSGSKLPTERTLSDKFSITRVTVRQALGRMEAEGLIYRVKRKGWFVSPPRIEYDPTENTSFTKSVSSQGRIAGTTVLFKQQIVASEWLGKQLGCEVGDPIYIINRLRTVDNRAVLVEQIHVKAKRCPGLLNYPLDQSMTDLMAKEFDIIEHRSHINMHPTALPESPAKALGVSAGIPSLYLSRVILDQYDEVIELDQEFWRHDAIDISISSRINPEEIA